MKRVHVVGRKNSGKTTLICDLVEHFRQQGLKIGTIKHTHHHHELDVPGKDSHRHREAGAEVVAILSPRMTAVFQPHGDRPDTRERYDELDFAFADCAVVLVEGHQLLPGPKLEVWRAATGQPPLASELRSIVAVVTDDPLPGATPTTPRHDLAKIAALVLRLAESEG